MEDNLFEELSNEILNKLSKIKALENKIFIISNHYPNSWIRKRFMEQAQDSAEQEQTRKMDIGLAIKNLRNGAKVARAGWNGKNMYLALQVPDTNSKMTLPYIYIFTADRNLVPWLASQTDILANDWEVV